MIQYDKDEVIRLKAIHDDFVMVDENLKIKRILNFKVKMNEYKISSYSKELIPTNKQVCKFKAGVFYNNETPIVMVHREIVKHYHYDVKAICDHDLEVHTYYHNNDNLFFVDYYLNRIFRVTLKCDENTCDIIKHGRMAASNAVQKWLSDRGMSVYTLTHEDIIMMNMELGL